MGRWRSVVGVFLSATVAACSGGGGGGGGGGPGGTKTSAGPAGELPGGFRCLDAPGGAQRTDLVAGAGGRRLLWLELDPAAASADWTLVAFDLPAGPPRTLARAVAPGHAPAGDGDSVVYLAAKPPGLYVVGAAGGEPRRLSSEGQVVTSFVAAGGTVTYAAWERHPGDAGIHQVSLAGGAPNRLAPGLFVWQSLDGGKALLAGTLHGNDLVVEKLAVPGGAATPLGGAAWVYPIDSIFVNRPGGLSETYAPDGFLKEQYGDGFVRRFMEPGHGNPEGYGIAFSGRELVLGHTGRGLWVGSLPGGLLARGSGSDAGKARYLAAGDGKTTDLAADAADRRLPGAFVARKQEGGEGLLAASPTGLAPVVAVSGGWLEGATNLDERDLAVLISHDTDGDERRSVDDETDACLVRAGGTAPLALPDRHVPRRFVATSAALDALADADPELAGSTSRFVLGGAALALSVAGEGPEGDALRPRTTTLQATVGERLGDPHLGLVVSFRGSGRRAALLWSAPRGRFAFLTGMGGVWRPDPVDYRVGLYPKVAYVTDYYNSRTSVRCSGTVKNLGPAPAAVDVECTRMEDFGGGAARTEKKSLGTMAPGAKQDFSMSLGSIPLGPGGGNVDVRVLVDGSEVTDYYNLYELDDDVSGWFSALDKARKKSGLVPRADAVSGWPSNTRHGDVALEAAADFEALDEKQRLAAVKRAAGELRSHYSRFHDGSQPAIDVWIAGKRRFRYEDGKLAAVGD